MFTNRLPDNIDYRVVFSDFAQRYFIKQFSKNYPGKQWTITQDSIFEQLKRVHAIQSTQQVDELKNCADCLLFKYDFAVAKTNVSAKTSGNRCVIFLDKLTQQQTILVLYHKSHLPKNKHENQYIDAVLKDEFPQFYARLHV